MSIKKAFLPLISVLALTSCGVSDYSGFYSFQLGSSKGAHFGLYLELSDELKEDESGDKKFTFSAELGSMITLEETLNKQDYDQAVILNNAFNKHHDQGNNPDFVITGYYKIGDELKNGDRQLYMDFETLFDITIPSELVREIVTSTINDSSVSLFIPVSLDDLIFQLYWYGYDFSEDSKITPTWHNEPGTHPDKEFITNIKTGFGDESLAWPSYRDYYTLNMGLIKAIE